VKELEERITAVEAWIERFEAEGEEFLKHMESLERDQLEVVFIPDKDLLRNKKHDN